MKSCTKVGPSIEIQEEKSDPCLKNKYACGLSMQIPFTPSNTPITTDSLRYVETSPNNLTTKPSNFLPIDLPIRDQMASTLSLPLHNDKTLHLAEHWTTTGNMHDMKNPISDSTHNFTAIPINSNDHNSTENSLALNSHTSQKPKCSFTSEINKLI